MLGSAAVPRRFRAGLVFVLALAAFNLSFWLTRETVAQWDESLYASSAVEMVNSGDWVTTTYHGRPDYYNSKPPLNTWILAASFKLAGINLLSLRLASVVAAWTTVLVLMLWAKRFFGDRTALLAGLILSTSFGFLHVHSGRSGNPDALMTLLLLLVLVVTSTADEKPKRLVWLGPLLAGVFLLKGMAVLLPLAFIAGAQVWRMRAGKAWPFRPLLVAASLMVVPALLWAVARWRADQWTFLQLLITQDLVLASTQALEGHAGSPLYYADILQRYQYDWLIAALVAATLFWSRVRECARREVAGLRRGEGATFVAVTWTIVILGVLTAMQTKLPWYLNPLYPVFALGVAGVLVTGLFARERSASFSSANSVRSMAWRRRTVWVVAALALVVAETKLLWQPVHNRDLAGSTQELLMSAREELEGHAVFRAVWLRDEVFVLSGISRASPAIAIDVTSFLEIAADGDFLLADANLTHPSLALVLSNGRHALFRRQ